MNRNMLWRIGAFAGLIFLVAGGLIGSGPAVRAQETQGAQAKDTVEYTLKRVYKAGEVDRYKLAVHVSNAAATGPATDITGTLVMKQTTKEVKADGAITLKIEFEKATGPQDVDLTSLMPTITVKRDKEGRTDVTTEGGNDLINGQIIPLVKGMFQAEAVLFPKRPVRVGDSWKIDYEDKPADQPATKVMGTATLAGTETIEGVKTLKIKGDVETTAPGQDFKMRNNIGGNLDPATGKLIRVTSKLEGTPPGGGSFSVEVNLNRLPKEEKAETKAEAKPETAEKK